MSATETLLAGMLSLAVPLAIDRIRSWDEGHRTARRIEAADFLAHHGDELQFRGKQTRAAFVACVDAVALLSFADGGVRFAGLNFCARHGGIVHPDSVYDKLCARCVEQPQDGGR